MKLFAHSQSRHHRHHHHHPRASIYAIPIPGQATSQADRTHPSPSGKFTISTGIPPNQIPSPLVTLSGGPVVVIVLGRSRPRSRPVCN